MKRRALAAEEILAVLNRHGVEYVVVGAFAAIAQGAPVDATSDIDLTPKRDPENLRRLSEALGELGARLRVVEVEEGQPFAHDPNSLASQQILNLTCSAGDFDLVFAPAATPAGYADLLPQAVKIQVGNQGALAASVEDVVRSRRRPVEKRTSGLCLPYVSSPVVVLGVPRDERRVASASERRVATGNISSPRLSGAVRCGCRREIL